MNRNKKLLRNSAIFLLGNLGSKLITFFMVPLYTYYLSTSEYGTLDIIQTSINLLIPILTLELGQAALRYTVEKKDILERKKIFSSIVSFCIIAALLVIILSPIVFFIDVYKGIEIIFIFLLILNNFTNVFMSYVRGIGKSKEFAINGIIITIVTVALNIVLLVNYNWGLKGYLISLLTAQAFSILYLLYVSEVQKNFRKKYINKAILSELIRFSFPIIPNTVMWWLINGSTRFFIMYYVGLSANGLFAVASKIPSIIAMITTIFTQAWQISSYEEYGSKDRDEFYSSIFEKYSIFIFVVTIGCLVIQKNVISFLVDETFLDSWKLIPFLVYGSVFQSLSSFLGTHYTASKQTKGTLTTSIYAGIASVICNIILIPYFGAFGASLTSFICFLILFLVRLVDTKKISVTRINWKKFIFSNVIFMLVLAFNYISIGQNEIIDIVIRLGLYLIFLAVIHKDILSLLKKIIKK